MRFWQSQGMVSRGTPSGPRIPKKWLVLPAALITASVGVVFFSGIFTIENVQFHGCGSVPADSLERVRETLLGENLATVSCDDARARLVSFPEVQDAVFKRRPPKRLDCYLVKREPVALLVAGNTREVDREGVILPRRAGKGDVDLPVITGIDQKAIGKERGRKSIARALEVLALFKELGFSPSKQLSEVHVSGDEIELVWMGTGTLIRLGRDGYPGRVRKLRTVFGTLNDREHFPQLIDLRFDRQVVIR